MNDVNRKMRQVNLRTEAFKEQSRKDQLIRQELRKLKEEDMKFAQEQQKRKAMNKKLEILEKEKQHSEQIDKNKRKQEIMRTGKFN